MSEYRIVGTAAKKAFSSPIVQRAEEEALKKGLGKVAGKAAGKALGTMGKAAPVAGLLLSGTRLPEEPNPWKDENYLKIKNGLNDWKKRIKAENNLSPEVKAEGERRRQLEKERNNIKNPLQVENSTKGIAGANPGNFIVRSNGEKYVLTEKDIKDAKNQLSTKVTEHSSTEEVKTPSNDEVTSPVEDEGKIPELKEPEVKSSFMEMASQPIPTGLDVINADLKRQAERMNKTQPYRVTIPKGKTSFNSELKDKGGNNDGKQQEEKLRTSQIEDGEKKKKEKSSFKKSENSSTTEWNSSGNPDFRNIIAYYRTGGYGDPNSKQAKKDMGYAILGQLGKVASQISNVANTAAGKAAVADTTSQWDSEQEKAQGQYFDFNGKDKDFDLNVKRMDKELVNNKEMQRELNKLQKDFQDWTIKQQIAYGSDAEKLEAIKKFVSANQNSLTSGGFMDTALKVFGGVAQVAPFLLMMMGKK